MERLKNIKADRRLVDMLYSENAIDKAGRVAALDMLYPADKWHLWISRLLLIIGGGLVMSGIIYFFAFNWNALATFVKFGLIEGAFVVALAAGYWIGFDRLGGKLALLVASVLIGVFMAVFGQIYQTGADAYTLFLNWAFLMLLWCVMARFIGLWVLWWLVSNMALWLWWHQVGWQTDSMRFIIYAYQALFNAACLFGAEFYARRQGEFLYIHWSRLAVGGGAILFAAISMIIFIVEEKFNPSAALVAIIGAVLHTGIYYYYRKILPDIRMMALLMLSAAIITEFILARVLFDFLQVSGAKINILIMGALTIGVFAYAVSYLRKLAQRMEVEAEHE